MLFSSPHKIPQFNTVKYFGTSSHTKKFYKIHRSSLGNFPRDIRNGTLVIPSIEFHLISKLSAKSLVSPIDLLFTN